MAAPNDEGPVLATPTPQEQNKADPAIVTDTGNAGKVRHPLSAAFGDIPAAEFAELVADIKRNGQINDIVVDDDGLILDGWHRYRACIAGGVIPRIEAMSNAIARAAETAGRTLTAAEFVVAQNARRRHLTAEQKRKIVAALLKAEPTKSDRTIGSMAKVDHKTVAAVRAKAEATGEIPQLSKTTGKDGKARPTKPAKLRLSKFERKIVEKTLAEKSRALSAEIAALNAKPEPAQADSRGDVTLSVPAGLLRSWHMSIGEVWTALDAWQVAGKAKGPNDLIPIPRDDWQELAERLASIAARMVKASEAAHD